jgi:hypothetical protein
MPSFVWSLTGTVSYTDNTQKSATILKDPDASKVPNLRVEGGLPELMALNEFKKAPSVKQFLAALGYTPSPSALPATVNDVIWRFMAITANGQIHVLGSTERMAAHLESDNLAAVLAVLNADPDFVLMMTMLGTA